MKTITIIIALVCGTGIQNVNAGTKITGLHFMITTDKNNLSIHPEITKTDYPFVVCDTINENVFALFKSKNYILTCRNLNYIKEDGVIAEIKAFFNETEITLDDAFIMLNNKNAEEGKEYSQESRRKLDEILKSNDQIKMFYSVTVSIANDSSVLNEYTKDLVYSYKESGSNAYLQIGKFLTFGDVRMMYDEMLENGITNISITASEFGREIPVSSAIGKEQEYLQQLLAVNE